MCIYCSKPLPSEPRTRMKSPLCAAPAAVEQNHKFGPGLVKEPGPDQA